jgi:DNA mismatch endonuclease (patch repair protein)
MASVGSVRTDLEQALAKAMWTQGVRGWRRSRPTEGARPDFAFVAPRVAVFVDGCFWHGCLECAKTPASNTAYWLPKIERNRKRDADQTRALDAAGWSVLRFWGNDIARDVEGCAITVAKAIAAKTCSTATP